MSDNGQVLDNLEAYVRDKLSRTRSLHDRLGLTENSLPGAQTITVVMVQSDQLTTRIPNYLPSNIEIGQQNDNDYPDDREDYLNQVDGTTDIHTPTDHFADDEDTEPDNNACKRQRKVYAPADADRKELTKERQAQVLKNQQETERLKAQTLENRDNTDRVSRTKSKRPTRQPEDNGDNIDNTNSPRPQRSKGKASHSDQIKSSNRGNIKDPIKDAIELFEHTLDKKTLIWFQQHKADFKDLTTMKNMFLARYNPWGKTKRDQLQSWNNLSFDPQKTDIDEQINLVLALGNMLKQDKQAKMDKFIETMSTIIQTHLIIAPNWEEVTKKAKNLEHIIQ